MSQLTDSRKKNRIIRIVVFAIIVLAAAGLLTWRLTREEPPPLVKTASPYYGSIASKMMVSAQIQPGAVINENPTELQRVVKVHVKPGTQIKKGNLLLTLDQSELEVQLSAAEEARRQVEAAIAEAEAAEAERTAAQKQQAADAERAAANLNTQAANLTESISDITASLVRLSTMQPVTAQANPQLSADLTQLLQSFDPQAPGAQEQLTAAVTLLSQEITYTENLEYSQLLTELEQDLGKMSADTTALVAALTSSNLSNDLTGISSDLTSQLTEQLAGQLGGLGGSLESALEQAIANEEAAKTRLENSKPELRASSDGVVVEINVIPGDYAGQSEASASASINSQDLSALLGLGSYADLSAISGLAQKAAAPNAIVIYDNIRPIAVFQANQFDVGRLSEGLTVDYNYDGVSYSGRLTYIAPTASGTSFQSGTTSALPTDLSSLSGLSDLSGEPTLEVKMSINGQNLTDLIPGFSINASIETQSADNTLILPAEAMRREIDSWYVFVVRNDGILEKRKFTPGIQAEMTVEILDGLSESDLVVLNPASILTNGMEVITDATAN
jgi:multidrug efflux pump subunit AcrA (membrane-fusion protein)